MGKKMKELKQRKTIITITVTHLLNFERSRVQCESKLNVGQIFAKIENLSIKL